MKMRRFAELRGGGALGRLMVVLMVLVLVSIGTAACGDGGGPAGGTTSTTTPSTSSVDQVTTSEGSTTTGPIATTSSSTTTSVAPSTTTTTSSTTLPPTTTTTTTTTTLPPTTTTTTRPPATTTTTTDVPDDPVLSIGDRGEAVREVQQRLVDLHYWLGAVDGIFGEQTFHAVVALQKVAGIERDGVVGPDTRTALEAGITPAAQSNSGRLVEIDLTHQVLLLVQDGSVLQVFDTSTGREGFRTPTGTFTIYQEVDGWHEAGWGSVWRPKYFYEPRELAIHAYKSVPAYPASHGCARLIKAAANWLWDYGNVPEGTTVLIY